MRKLTIVNQKGGSGKTTTVVNLAAALAERRQRVLVIDLDPQASASHWFRVEGEDRGLLSLFTAGGRLRDLVRATQTEGVDLVPSSRWLIGAEQLSAMGRETTTRLRAQLNGGTSEEWDFVLIDCPPTLGMLTVSALAAADSVLIPVEAKILPLQGLAHLLETIDVVRDRLNPALSIAGILPCRVDRRTRLATEIVSDLRRRFGDLVYPVVIRENVRLAECPSFGQPILRYSTASAGAQDYRALAGAVLSREKGEAHGAPGDR